MWVVEIMANLESWSGLRRELDKIYALHPKLNRVLPSKVWLLANSHSSISNAIQQYHGGFIAVRQRLKQKLLRKNNGYWKVWKNYNEEMQDIVDTLGHFPTQTELSDLGRNDLIISATRRWMGLGNVRKKMGYESIRKPKNYWSWENMRDELKKLVSTLGYFPSQIEFKKMNLDSLNGAINRHGGMVKVQHRLENEMGKKLDRDKSWYLRDIERKIGQDLGTYLHKQYVEERLPAYKIAKELEVGKSSLIRWLKLFGIETRSISEARIDPSRLPNKAQLQKEIDRGNSIKRIGVKYGVSEAPILRLINEYGINFPRCRTKTNSLLEKYTEE
jgi:hypothetical protein